LISKSVNFTPEEELVINFKVMNLETAPGVSLTTTLLVSGKK